MTGLTAHHKRHASIRFSKWRLGIGRAHFRELRARLVDPPDFGEEPSSRSEPSLDEILQLLVDLYATRTPATAASYVESVPIVPEAAFEVARWLHDHVLALVAAAAFGLAPLPV